MNFRGLAVELAERLAEQVPAGLEVREEPEGYLQLRLDESRFESFPLDEPEILQEVDPATYDPPYPAFGVLEALDFVQEFVRHELGLEWEQGEPWADIEDDEIRFGYEGGRSYDPIPLSALNA